MLVTPDQRQKLGRMDVVGFEEPPVATATIHERRRQLAAQLSRGLWDDAWQPFDSLDEGCLGWQRRFIQHHRGGLSCLDVEEIIAPDEFDRQRRVPRGFAAPVKSSA